MAGVSYTRTGKIAHIRLNAPDGNAFTPELRRELNAAIQGYRDDEDAWAAVVSSEGNDFCLGSADGDPGKTRERNERRRLWAGGYVEVWKPTIAAIQGECSGEGLALALSCDLRVAAADVRLRFGLPQSIADPDVLAALLVPLCGISTTFELLYLERTLNATEAQDVGLVNRPVLKGEPAPLAPEEGRFPMNPMQDSISVLDGDVRAGAERFAEEILQYAPLTRTLQKFASLRAYGVPYQYAQSWNTGPDPYTGHDRLEGNRAFAESRRPEWTQNWTRG
jgi:enoyl-CoA hydratase/carnithine racemase